MNVGYHIHSYTRRLFDLLFSSLTGYEQYGTTDWCGLDYFKVYVPSSPPFPPSLLPLLLLTHHLQY